MTRTSTVDSNEVERLLASLEAERSRLAIIFERAPAFMAVMRGPTYIFERANPACHELLGRTELVGKTVLEAVPEVEAQGFIALLDHVRTTGEPFIGKQVPVSLLRGPDATPEVRYMDFVYLRIDDPDGEVRVCAHGIDITEQVVAANALRETQNRLRDQFAKLPVPTFLWELCGDDFVLIDCNDAGLPLIEPQWGEAIGRRATQLFPGGWPLLDDVRRSLRDGVVVRRTFVADRVNGAEPRTFDLTIGPQPPDRVLIHAIDTTEQTRLAIQLRQAQKMDAVGQLAGGVAHDFNNLLTVISAHSALLIEELGEDDVRHQDARAIQQASARAASLTRQLLAFSRKQILRPALVDLNLVVDETRRLLDRLVGEDIEIDLTMANDLGLVLVDIGQVEQVVMNLVLNSRDAMISGGRLAIATRNVTVAADAPKIRGIVPAGAYAVLSVSDTGTGMDEQTQARVFEPFFTTKPMGKGTGLGLSTVYGIVKQSGGYVLVESELGTGTTFDVYLPIVAGDRIAEVQQTEESPAEQHAETILLVEDDAAVRQVAKRILRAEGYDVLEARDGEDALALSTLHAGIIDAVITDAVMPGITGAELLDRVRAQRPGCKAILMSGYTNDEMTRRGISSSEVTFVQKPFSIEDFARIVRLSLDS